MAGRDYPRLDIETFGRHLITTGDLDPIYIGLHKAGLERDQLYRWLVAYWCFYHAGAASYISEAEGESFWLWMMIAAKNVALSPADMRWPRGHERRHFRGRQAERGVEELIKKYKHRPEGMIDYLLSGYYTFKGISARAMEHRSFGPWISFKVCDMIDRLGIASVVFTMDDAMYEGSPTKAAFDYFDIYGAGSDPYLTDKDKISYSVNSLITEFRDLKAPPLEDRPIGYQEVETILCKWKSHRSGHYPLFNDIDEINNGLAPWAKVSDTAARLLAVMPKRNGATDAKQGMAASAG